MKLIASWLRSLDARCEKCVCVCVCVCDAWPRFLGAKLLKASKSKSTEVVEKTLMIIIIIILIIMITMIQLIILLKTVHGSSDAMRAGETGRRSARPVLRLGRGLPGTFGLSVKSYRL